MKTTLDEYLGKKGLAAPFSDYMFDKLRIPHGLTLSKEKEMLAEASRVADDYRERRNLAIREFQAKVEAGEIQIRSAIEQTIIAANGHPDNESTKAARRRLAKKGIELCSLEEWEEVNGHAKQAV